MEMAHRAGTLLCVYLVLLVSLVAVTHVHANTSNAQDHSCSICALAHSGVAPAVASAPAIVFATSVMAVLAPEIAHSLLLSFTHCIRPPPVA